MGDKPWYYWEDDALVLRVRVQPKASCNEIVGPIGDELKIRITAPPVDGHANEGLIAFLAKSCRVAKTSIELMSGFNGRSKQLRIRKPTTLPPGVMRAPF